MLETKDLVRALRKRLKMSQEAVADAGGLGRTQVVHVESGRNQATTDLIRGGLAKAFRLSRDELAAYLGERLSLEETASRSIARMDGGAPPPSTPVQWTELDDRYPNFARAARMLLEAGEVSETTVQEESQVAMHREFDLDVTSWRLTLEDSERKRRLRARNPDDAARHEAQGKGQGDDDDDPPIGATLNQARKRR